MSPLAVRTSRLEEKALATGLMTGTGPPYQLARYLMLYITRYSIERGIERVGGALVIKLYFKLEHL